MRNRTAADEALIDAACAGYQAEPGQAPEHLRSPEAVRQFFEKAWRTDRDAVRYWATRHRAKSGFSVYGGAPVRIHDNWVVQVETERRAPAPAAALPVAPVPAVAVVQPIAPPPSPPRETSRPRRRHWFALWFEAQQRRAYARRYRAKHWLRGIILNYLCW